MAKNDVDSWDDDYRLNGDIGDEALEDNNDRDRKIRKLMAQLATKFSAISASLLPSAATADRTVYTAAGAWATTALTAVGRAIIGLAAYGTAGQVLATNAGADGVEWVSIASSGVDYQASRAAVRALDTSTVTRILFDGSAWEWDSSDLSATLGYQSVTSTSVDAGTETITSAAHELQAQQAVYPTTSVNGLTAGTIYYVIAVDANSFRLAASHADAVAGTPVNLSGTTNFTVTAFLDPIEAAYIIPTGKAYDGSEGAWVRKLDLPGVYAFDWGGAAAAADTLEIFDSMKFLARGGELWLGAQTYPSSKPWKFTPVSGENAGLAIVGRNAETTVLSVSHSDYAIYYEGRDGGGEHVQGGGVSNLSIAKTGGGSCNGVRIANNYHSTFHHLNTTQCGGACIGFHFYAPSAGDTSASYGVRVHNCNFQSGQIGVYVFGASNSVAVSQCDLDHCQMDSNTSCGVWVANAIGFNITGCNMTNCGDGASGAYTQRGGLYVDINGNTPQKITTRRCEFGNNTTSGQIAAVFIDAVIKYRSFDDRFVRNSGEYLDYCYRLGYDTTTAVINEIEVHTPEIVADGGTVYVLSFGGTGKTYNKNVQIFDPYTVSGTTAYCDDLTEDFTVFIAGRELRASAARVDTTRDGSGNAAISSNTSLYHRVIMNATGGTVIDLTGRKHDGDILTLEVYNSSGGTTLAVPTAGFGSAANSPSTVGGLFRALFKYSSTSGAWEQFTGWYEYP